jgi:hypothetical protein
VIRDEVWIGNWIYLTHSWLQITTTVSLSYNKDHCNYSTHKVFSVLNSRCLVAVSNGGRSTSSWLLNCPQPQLPTSHFLNCNFQLTQLQLHGPQRERLLHYCVFSRCRVNTLSTELFPSNSCGTVSWLRSCYLAIGLVVTVLSPSLLSVFVLGVSQYVFKTCTKVSWNLIPAEGNNMAVTNTKYLAFNRKAINNEQFVCKGSSFVCLINLAQWRSALMELT